MKKYKIKIPDSDKYGLWMIKKLIPVCPNKKLYGIQGILDSYSESDAKQKIQEMLNKEFKKRGLKNE